MTNWIYYPKSDSATDDARKVVAAFTEVESRIDSATHDLPSNAVLALVAPGLVKAGFMVESSRKSKDCIRVPVLFGLNGKLEKSFQADSYNESGRFVVEVEAGRAVTNHQFLKDLFQACMMHNVLYFGVAVRNRYRGASDFDSVCKFFNTLYASNRLHLPLEGILVIGY